MSDVRLKSLFLPQLCFLLTGMSALICEICWIRIASLAFGSSTWAISVLLAVFFAGLALGSYGVGRISRTIAIPLRGYAWLELGVGVMALLSPWMFVGIDWIYSQIYSNVFDSVALLAVTRLLLVSLVLLPATVLMGGSLPLFCQQFIRRDDRVARGIGFLYGINTFGAAAGAALTGFWLIPNLGVSSSLGIAAAINFAVSFVAFRLSRGENLLPVPVASEESAASSERVLLSSSSDAKYESTGQLGCRSLTRHQRLMLAWIFFGIGFVAVGAEVLWTRYLSLWMPNTVYTYTLTLSVVLLGIVIGSLLSALFADRIRWRSGLLGWAQVIGALSIMLVMQLKPGWWGEWLNAISLSQQLLVVAIVMLPPSILSGISFPIAISLVMTDARQSGADAGRMTAINLVGGILGSLVIGFVSLPYFGLQFTLFFVSGLGMVLGVIAWWSLVYPVSWSARVALMLVVFLTWLGIPGYFRTELPREFLATEGELIDFREGFNANVSVVRQGNMLHLEINRMWQGQNVKNHQIFAAHIPALLHPTPEQVLVIGLGTGQTARSFLDHNLQRLDCLEIEDGLIQLVKEYFDGAWMEDPRVHMIVEDGRSYVTHTTNKYDIISIEVGQIYRPRIASFYTADFYQKLRPRLNDNGLVCQFLPIEFFSADEFRTLVATFRDAFPECMLWYNTSELLLIGSVKAEFRFDPERFNDVLARNERVKQDLDYAYWGGPDYYLSRPESFTAGFLCGPAQLERISAGGSIYRDDRPYMEYLPLRVESEAPSIIKLLQNQLTPLPALIGNSGANWLAKAHQIRAENLQEIFARVVLARADGLEEIGELEGAFENYQAALEILPNYPKANAGLADFLYRQGELPAAITLYQRALAVQPTYSHAQFQLGAALIAIGNPKEAQPLLEAFLTSQPQHAGAQAMLGEILLATGQFAEAEGRFRQSLRGNVKQAETMVNLATALLYQGKDQLAKLEYEKALKAKPMSSELPISMGWAYGQVGRNVEAMECFEAALAVDPQATRALLGAANVLQSMGETQQAQLAYEEILASDAGRIEARIGLAFSQQSSGDVGAALKNFELVLKEYPTNVTVMNAVAWLLATHPDSSIRAPEQAQALAEKAWALSGQQSPEAADALAAAYAALQKFELASETASLAMQAADALQLTEMVKAIEQRKALYDRRETFTQ